MLSPRAKPSKLYRPCVGGKVGEWCSRYCKDIHKLSGKCKEYAYERIDSTTEKEWEFIKAASMVLVGIDQL